MNVLVIGGGGREHAIVKQFAKSSRVDGLYCLPGNAGIAEDAECISGSVMDFPLILSVCKEKKIDLCFVAPDDPLGGGLVDYLSAAGVKAFGPQRTAAAIEASKAFSKDFMKRNNIPTASYAVFSDYERAIEYLFCAQFPLVIKADGLALGKGVLICNSLQEGEKALRDIMLDKVFGPAGNNVVIEEFLVGKEVSLLVFTDGKAVKTMPSSQDHKKVFDGDKGLNTGGMGAFTPSRAYTAEIEAETLTRVIYPTVEGLRKENREFRGVLYFGLMLTDKGVKVLEYNARFGDPETQAVLPLLETDFVDVCEAVIDGKLDEMDIKWRNAASMVVILASGGYPEKYKKGYPISFGALDEGVTVFHSGTAKQNGTVVTSGGRVLGVATVADTIEEARKVIYRNLDKIRFEGLQYRTDIGVKA